MNLFPNIAEQLNWPEIDMPAFVFEGISTQRAVLSSVIELAYAPFLSVLKKPASLRNDELTAKLIDPALSFTRAVETAEPLFDILSDEEV
jgi:hypothetical protein